MQLFISKNLHIFEFIVFHNYKRLAERVRRYTGIGDIYFAQFSDTVSYVTLKKHIKKKQ